MCLVFCVLKYKLHPRKCASVAGCSVRPRSVTCGSARSHGDGDGDAFELVSLAGDTVYRFEPATHRSCRPALSAQTLQSLQTQQSQKSRHTQHSGHSGYTGSARVPVGHVATDAAEWRRFLAEAALSTSSIRVPFLPIHNPFRTFINKRFSLGR